MNDQLRWRLANIKAGAAAAVKDKAENVEAAMATLAAVVRFNPATQPSIPSLAAIR